MVFSSLLFIFIFLPAVFFTYYISPRKLKNPVLVIASLIFYAWGEPVYIGLMLLTATLDYTGSLLIDRYREKKMIRLGVLISCMTADLGILFFFKYYDFLINNINILLQSSINTTDLALPIGISFYTFQSMSYVIDVYLDKVKAQKNIINYATYLTMFPQLIAGPIVKYIEVAREVENRRESLALFGEGAELFMTGLAKKVLLANNIAILWTSVKPMAGGELSVATAWLGIIAFSFQIYFDFSGYSDMALGLGKMFGFNFLKNFNYPYISNSITEFWRRWHISLGSWFREYLYIPLGGNKEGSLKQYRNLFIVWFLTGLWHGANWNFIIWGLYFGIFVTVEKIFLLKWLDNIPSVLRHIYTLVVVIVGWVIFEFESIYEVAVFIGVMFGFGTVSLIDSRAIYYIYSYGILLIICAVCSTPILKKAVIYLEEKMTRISAAAMPAVYLLLVFFVTAYLVNQSYNPFLYFRF